MRSPTTFSRPAAPIAVLTVLLCAMHPVPVVSPASASAAPAEAAPGLYVVGQRDEPYPVVNERRSLRLKVVDGNGKRIEASSWSSDSTEVATVSASGEATGLRFGFATIMAQTSLGPAQGTLAVARVTARRGSKGRADAKADANKNIYASSPRDHVILRSFLLSDPEVFAGKRRAPGWADGDGRAAQFSGPTGLGIDPRADGALYIADTDNHCIRKVDFQGHVSTAAGTPTNHGPMRDDATKLEQAAFNKPQGVAARGKNLFVADTGNQAIYYVDFARKMIDLVAGHPGTAGLRDGKGDKALFSSPSGIAINAEGDLLAVADKGGNAVRLIRILEKEGGGVVGDVKTLRVRSSAPAATVAAARADDPIPFVSPESVSFDGVGNVYVVDAEGASVVTRPVGRPPEKIDLAQEGSIGDAVSVTTSGTETFVLDEGAEEDEAVKVVEVGPPSISSVSPDIATLEGGQTVTIDGENFAPETELTLGDTVIADYEVETARRIRFVVPKQQLPGGRTLTVATRGGVAQKLFTLRSKTAAELAVGQIGTAAGGVSYLGDGGAAVEARIGGDSRVTMDARGNLYVADTANHRIRRVGSTGRITTVAGTGEAGFGGDGQLATSARLNAPEDVAVDAAGNLLIADAGNNRIRRVDTTTRRISTIVGTGRAGFRGERQPAVSAWLNAPLGVAVDSEGGLLIADSLNNLVRRVNMTTGLIETVAGTGAYGSEGDGGPAVEAQFAFPTHVAIDAEGNILIADTNNGRVRRVDTAGRIMTLAADVSFPFGVAADAAGNVLIAEAGNHRVLFVDRATGAISAVAGTGTEGFEGDHGEATVAQLSHPTGVTADGAGDLVIADAGNGRIRRVAAVTRVIETIAGTGIDLGGDGDLAVRARVEKPNGIAVDAAGALLVSDIAGNRVRRVDALTGEITTVAGTGEAGFDGDGLLAAEAKLNGPTGIEVDSEGNLLIADAGNHRVRRVDATTGRITTVAGTGEPGFSGDGGPSVDARLNTPESVAFDRAGNLLIADSENNRIRRVAAETGRITTVAGRGRRGFAGDGGPARRALLRAPAGVAVDAAGNLLIADTYNNRVRRVDASTGRIETIVGAGRGYAGDLGPAREALLDFPQGIRFDRVGNLLIADTDNHVVRRVDRLTGVITTVAGTARPGRNGDDRSATRAGLNSPTDVAVDAAGNVLIADSGNGRIRLVKSASVR